MEVKEFLSHEIPVSCVHVETKEDALALGRPCGCYTTIETGRLDHLIHFENACACLAEQLQPLLRPYFGKVICVCGIGNQSLPYDALGPETAKRFQPQAYEALITGSQFEKIAVICPGVKALTNLSSETIISSVASTIGAACVLTVDACMCADAKRLCSTIQLTSSGMRTYYNTAELCQNTLGIPVISIAVPTTIRAADLSAQKGADPELILTPLHVLDSVKIASFVIASAIAQVAYPELDYESSKQYIELFLHGII